MIDLFEKMISSAFPENEASSNSKWKTCYSHMNCQLESKSNLPVKIETSVEKFSKKTL